MIRGRAEAGRDVSEVVDGARTELERIDAIIRHILAFGQTEEAAAAQPLSDPVQVLEGVLSEIRVRRSLDERLLRLEAAADLPLVRAHPRIIERLVTNLVHLVSDLARRPSRSPRQPCHSCARCTGGGKVGTLHYPSFVAP